MKLLLEAAPGAPGLASSILRHSKGVFWRERKKEVPSVNVRKKAKNIQHLDFRHKKVCDAAVLWDTRAPGPCSKTRKTYGVPGLVYKNPNPN